MNNLDELLELAKNATSNWKDKGSWFHDHLVGYNIHGNGENDEQDAWYIEAANPSTIIKLIEDYKKALEVIKFYGTFQPRQHPEGYYEMHISEGMGGEDRFGTKAREFLRSVGNE